MRKKKQSGLLRTQQHTVVLDGLTDELCHFAIVGAVFPANEKLD